MGELILCRGPITATPYYIEEKALNVYSLEELSYYIYNNLYLINPGFMNNDLIHWIGNELGEKKLAAELMELLAENVPVHIFIGHILDSCGYLTGPEIKTVMKEAQTLQNKTEAECRKIRGDHLLMNDRITDALYEYDSILRDKEVLHLPIGLEGDIYHNLATCYMRLFFFNEAITSYRSAYERNHRKATLRALLEAYLIADDQEGFQTTCQHYLVSAEDVDEVLKAVSFEANSDAIKEFSESIDSYFTTDVTSESRTSVEKVNELVEQWKTDYIRQCRI
ncbi:MAG: hypothetical protein SPK77_00755 [Lachnospiraceae bacterium]|nr:hypothetical protein [Lachnospiraceae bacterium]